MSPFPHLQFPSALAESAVATLTDAIRDRRDVRAAQFVIKHLAAAARRK